MENQRGTVGLGVTTFLVLAGMLLGILSGWVWGNQYTAGYELQVDALESELAVCEQNYEQVIDALNEQNITHGLPADDQIANLLEAITDNGTIKYDVTLNYRLDEDGIQYGEITISLKRGDKVDTD